MPAGGGGAAGVPRVAPPQRQPPRPPPRRPRPPHPPRRPVRHRQPPPPHPPGARGPHPPRLPRRQQQPRPPLPPPRGLPPPPPPTPRRAVCACWAVCGPGPRPSVASRDLALGVPCSCRRAVCARPAVSGCLWRAVLLQARLCASGCVRLPLACRALNLSDAPASPLPRRARPSQLPCPVYMPAPPSSRVPCLSLLLMPVVDFDGPRTGPPTPP